MWPYRVFCYIFSLPSTIEKITHKKAIIPTILNKKNALHVFSFYLILSKTNPCRYSCSLVYFSQSLIHLTASFFVTKKTIQGSKYEETPPPPHHASLVTVSIKIGSFCNCACGLFSDKKTCPTLSHSAVWGPVTEEALGLSVNVISPGFQTDQSSAPWDRLPNKKDMQCFKYLLSK